MNIRTDVRLAVLAAVGRLTDAQYTSRLHIVRNRAVNPMVPVCAATVATLTSPWGAL